MKYKCAFCSFQTDDIVTCGTHYETAHRNLIPSGMAGDHFAYYILTGRKHGDCVVCKKATKWNPQTHKYCRICDTKGHQCAREYGKIKGLTNPKIQQEMLANRRISGEYSWSRGDRTNGHRKFQYTGSYEQDYLQHMDLEKHWDPLDIMMPCPHIFEYRYEGQKRFYIPDSFIVSYNLIVEIKDGDPNNPEHNANKHPEIMRVNRVKEQLKRAAVRKSKYHYIVVYNKDYRALDAFLATGKKMYLTEGVGKALDALTEVGKELLPSFDDQLLNFIDEWKKYVKDKELERYCRVSLKLNDTIYNTIKSDAFQKALDSGQESKVFIPDLLKIVKETTNASLCIMDDDSDIKTEFGDPYHLYSSEYIDAKKQLLKWKKPLQFVYIASDADISFLDEGPTRLVQIEWSDDSAD